MVPSVPTSGSPTATEIVRVTQCQISFKVSVTEPSDVIMQEWLNRSNEVRPLLALWLVGVWFDNFFVLCGGKSEFSVEFLKIMRNFVRRKTQKILIQIWIIHHENVSHHTSLAERWFLTMNQNFNHTNPPNVPYIDPCDLCLCWGFKSGLKFRPFAR